MKERRINFDYLNLYQEIPLFCALIARSFFRKKPKETSSATLIVNTCLIGEFAASLPAIRDYIERRGGLPVDLMVSSPLKPLAERVLGVRNVYVAQSLYDRQGEQRGCDGQIFPSYDTVFVMRVSRDVFRLIREIPARKIRTGLIEYSGYAVHLWGSLLSRKPPKQWRELNFEMLGGQMRKVPFDEIFNITEHDRATLAHIEELRTSQKKIFIHTGASWPMKKWKTDRWAEFIRMANTLGDMRFIFVGGAEAIDDYVSIAAQLNFPVYSLIDKINLFELLIVLHEGDYFIGVDSGPRNLAHLADIRTIAIFGPGPHFYMPWDVRDIAIDKSRGRGLFQMFVRTKHGFIDEIMPIEVYDAFKKIWNS